MMLNLSQLEVALAALRPETRAKVEQELQAALTDTREELSKTQLLLKLNLAVDCACLQSILDTSRKVSKEYDEICRG